jgi:hypothetical protein
MPRVLVSAFAEPTEKVVEIPLATGPEAGGNGEGVACWLLKPQAHEAQEATPVSGKYQVLPPTAPVPAPDDTLEQMVRQGARQMLQRALEAEVAEFLGRDRYERGGEFRGYRNGRSGPRSTRGGADGRWRWSRATGRAPRAGPGCCGR